METFSTGDWKTQNAVTGWISWNNVILLVLSCVKTSSYFSDSAYIPSTTQQMATARLTIRDGRSACTYNCDS